MLDMLTSNGRVWWERVLSQYLLTYNVCLGLHIEEIKVCLMYTKPCFSIPTKELHSKVKQFSDSSVKQDNADLTKLIWKPICGTILPMT